MTSSVELAAKLISFKSVTPNDDGAISFLSELLKSHGYKIEIAEFGQTPIKNLYARIGTTSPNLCFAGHTDVVPVGDEKAWSVDPFGGVIKDGFLIGRGAVDMKTSIACFISAAKQFIDTHQNFGSISFLITGDEEADAIDGTVKMLKHINDTLDHCIVGEPTNPSNLGEMIKIGRRGSATFTIRVDGTQGHVAYPHNADNPITHLVKILNELKSKKLDDGNENFDPSNLEIVTIDVGNKATNVIPAHATANVNIRFNNFHTPDSLYALISETCKKYADGKFEIIRHNPAESFITENSTFANLMAQSIKEVLGMDTVLSTTGGTSDARFIKDYCPVIEFGLVNESAHKIDEKVKIIDIENLTKIYYTFIRKYFQKA